MTKSTESIKREAEETGLEATLRANALRSCSLRDELLRIMYEKKLSNKDVYLGAGWTDGNYLSKMLNGTRTNVAREKLIPLLFGLRLTPDEADAFLKRTTGQILYAKAPRDLAIRCCLKDGLSIDQAEARLYDLGQQGLLTMQDAAPINE